MGLFNDPSKAAQQYYNQIPGVISPYYQPYIQQGQNAMNQLMPQYSQLINNPGGFLNQMGQGFHQSPGYQFQVNQALGAANRAGAAGGMLGSPEEQQNIASTVNNLADQDYYNWLGQASNMYGAGLQGLQGMNQMGFNASDTLASSLANNFMNQGNLAYAGQANQNQQRGGLFGQGLGLLGSALGSFGGPIGTGVGGLAGRAIGNGMSAFMRRQ